jgi:peptidoglycan/LPS O-acetylase OafA/YrhL
MVSTTDETASPTAPDRLATVDALRGLAALAVVWMHITNAHPSFPASPWLRASGAWGWLGVESFFVISGFVLPLTMHRGGYRLHDAGRFLARRLIRLHPAYLVSIAVTLALWWLSSLSPNFDRQPPGATQLLLHLAYLPRFFGYDWVNTVYWTLGIEFQFYVLMACAMPLLIHGALSVRLGAIAVAAGLSLVDSPDFLVSRYLVVFAMGTTAFLMTSGAIARAAGIAVVTALGVVAWITHGLPVALVAAATAALVAFDIGAIGRPVLSVGALSYSLYLIHGPVGGRVVNLGARYSDGPAAELLVTLLAVLLSLIAAYVLYRLVEQPSQRLAAQLKRRRRGVGVQPDPTYARL